MIDITILAVGKMKNASLNDLAEEYVRRLRPFARVAIREVAHEPFRSDADRERAKLREAEHLERELSPERTTIFLEENGTELTSEAFASFMRKFQDRGEKLTFVIGGALGLHPSLRPKAAHRLSLSPLTFPHELARVILLEQLYRSATIIAGKSYHY